MRQQLCPPQAKIRTCARSLHIVGISMLAAFKWFRTPVGLVIWLVLPVTRHHSPDVDGIASHEVYGDEIGGNLHTFA